MPLSLIHISPFKVINVMTDIGDGWRPRKGQRDIYGNDIVVVIAVGVDAVGNFHAVDVLLPLARTPAFSDIRRDIDDLKGRKKAVFNAFF